MNVLLLQSSTESLTRLQQTIGLIAVNVGAAVATCVVILKFVNDVRANLKQARQTAKELLNSKEEIVGAKEEIVAASERNYRAIQQNTALTEKQAVEIQKHLSKRFSEGMNVLSQRVAHIESKLLTDDDGNTPTVVWQHDVEDESK